jgi:hypothetical protein
MFVVLSYMLFVYHVSHLGTVLSNGKWQKCLLAFAQKNSGIAQRAWTDFYTKANLCRELLFLTKTDLFWPTISGRPLTILWLRYYGVFSK